MRAQRSESGPARFVCVPGRPAPGLARCIPNGIAYGIGPINAWRLPVRRGNWRSVASRPACGNSIEDPHGATSIYGAIIGAGGWRSPTPAASLAAISPALSRRARAAKTMNPLQQATLQDQFRKVIMHRYVWGM